MTFDDILTATANGSGNIAREQNDIGQINSGFDSGQAVAAAQKVLDRRRNAILDGWDSYEMGMTLEQAEAEFAKATSPEELAKVEADLRERAIRRANLANFGGRVRVFYSLDEGDAWHQAGTATHTVVTAADAIRLAGLNWRVKKEQVRVDEFGTVPGAYVLGRVEDDGRFLPFEGSGSSVIVGERYEVFQNDEAFAFLDEMVKDSGAKYSSAGALGNGEKIFIQLKLDAVAEPVEGDVVEPYLTLINPHGLGAYKVFATATRAVCQNTTRQAFSRRNKDRSISIPHTKNMRTKVAAARDAVLGAKEAFEKYSEAAEVMTKTPANPQHFASDVLDAVLDITAADAAKGANALAAAVATTEAERDLLAKRFDRKIRRRGEVLEDILSRHESATNSQAPGTVWSSYNAVTEYANHGLRYRGSQAKRQDARFESVLDGRADEISQAAYSLAEAAIAN